MLRTARSKAITKITDILHTISLGLAPVILMTETSMQLQRKSVLFLPTIRHSTLLVCPVTLRRYKILLTKPVAAQRILQQTQKLLKKHSKTLLNPLRLILALVMSLSQTVLQNFQMLKWRLCRKSILIVSHIIKLHLPDSRNGILLLKEQVWQPIINQQAP